MATEHRISHPEDPLSGYSTLNLFPRTLRGLTESSMPTSQDDVDFLHPFLNSTALNDPLKLKDQAMAVMNRGSEPLNSSVLNHAAAGDKAETVAIAGKENPRHRRPDLGRKRARFSFTHNPNGPSVNLMPSLDAAELNDPVEYFLAHEKLEKAKEEIHRQTGTAQMDADVNKKKSGISRPRRPGLLGKSASYRHLYPPMASNEVGSGFSKESLEPNIPTPTDHHFQQAPGDLIFATQEKESSGSEIDAEQRVSGLLDDLLSVDYEALNGDDAVNLLQERLQIKKFDVGKMHLPEFHEFQRSDSPVLSGNLLKPNNALVDIQNTHATMSNKTPEKHQHEKFSGLLRGSPTPPKSPLANINSLNKHILRSGGCSVRPIRIVGRPGMDDSKNDLKAGNLKDVAVGNKSSNPEADSNVQLVEQCEPAEETPHNHGNAGEGLPEEVLGTARPGSDIGELNVENLNSSCSPIGEPIPVDDRQPGPQVIDPEPQFNQPSAQMLNEKTKTKAPPRKRKELPGRQSLAGAGTSWKSGVRRSTRIRSRPLKFWKGERFLYGRVHSSMTTVIGLKYASPLEKGKGEATLKVMSYVSDEFKELVEFAALH